MLSFHNQISILIKSAYVVINMKSLKVKRLLVGLILLAILLLYILFLYLDLSNTYKGDISHKLKYISILLCLILSLLIQDTSLNFKDALLLQLGLLFTSLADLFFLLLDYYPLGVATFCLVQIIYSIRYQPRRVYSTIVGFLIFIVTTAIGFLMLSIFSKDIQPLYLLAFLYGILIITSLLRAIKSFEEKVFPSPNRYMIVVGMILFILCDINVCLNYLGGSTKSWCLFLNKYKDTCSFLIWLFYLPSQVLLGLSGYDWRRLFDGNG